MKSCCMKSGICAAGLLALSLLGCEKTTTTGPATPTTTTPRTSPTAPVSPTTTPSTSSETKKLTLMAMKSQTIKQGDTDKVLVTVTRDHFDDAVTVGFEGLPKGVTVADSQSSIAKGDNTVTLTLKAADDADVGEHQVTLFAQAPGIDKNTQVFTLKVDKK